MNNASPLCISIIGKHFFRPFSTNSPQPRILDLVNPRLSPNPATRETHLRLVDNILKTNCFQTGPQDDDHPVSVFGLDRKGLISNPSIISRALSFCSYKRSLFWGTQLHCLGVKSGLFPNVYLGSSLISFYSKSNELNNARKVFDEMPERNVVSWTALISGAAEEGRNNVCLELYNMMRNTTQPNDLTLTCLLSAVSQSGCLVQGRSAHCQAIQMGLDSFLTVSNVLVSLYCKMGDAGNAFLVFRNIKNKDVVSWSSMINGCAQLGLATEAIDLFEAMKMSRCKPDAITFLGILSSCRHMGLVKLGQFYFNSMGEFGLKPDIDHYSCIVDLLARLGDLKRALDFIRKMPVKPNAVIWGTLLSSCIVHREVWIGIEAANNKLALEPDCKVTHLHLVKLYSGVGRWDEVARVRKLMKDRGLKTDPGVSWIEIKNEVHLFRAEDGSNSKMAEVANVVDCLIVHMRNLALVFEVYELDSGFSRL